MAVGRPQVPTGWRHLSHNPWAPQGCSQCGSLLPPEWEREAKTEAVIFYNLILEVTSYLFCLFCSLEVSCPIQSLLKEGGDYTRGGYQELPKTLHEGNRETEHCLLVRSRMYTSERSHWGSYEKTCFKQSLTFTQTSTISLWPPLWVLVH